MNSDALATVVTELANENLQLRLRVAELLIEVKTASQTEVREAGDDSE